MFAFATSFFHHQFQFRLSKWKSPVRDPPFPTVQHSSTFHATLHASYQPTCEPITGWDDPDDITTITFKLKSADNQSLTRSTLPVEFAFLFFFSPGVSRLHHKHVGKSAEPLRTTQFHHSVVTLFVSGGPCHLQTVFWGSCFPENSLFIQLWKKYLFCLITSLIL